jgi:hypothetical protein
LGEGGFLWQHVRVPEEMEVKQGGDVLRSIPNLASEATAAIFPPLTV